MAYMNQEKKQSISAALKAVMPKDWKWSLSVSNHTTIVLTIAAAPHDLVGMAQAKNDEIARQRGETQGYKIKDHFTLNHHRFDESEYGAAGPVLAAAIAALYADHWDQSDIQTDYFHCAYYVDVQIGRWNKPFVCTEPVALAA